MLQPKQEQEEVVIKGLMGKDRTLSWTQIFLVNNSPRQYYKKYILGEKLFKTKETIKGEETHKRIEEGEDLGLDTDLEEVDKKELWIECMFNDSIKLVGQLDGFSHVDGIINIAERKTGKSPWFQEKVDTHGQLKMYAYIIYKRDGILPKECTLEWIKTREENGQIVLTGEVEKFTKVFTEQDLVDAEKMIKEAIEKIEHLVNNYDKNSELILEYIGWKQRAEQAEAEMDKVKERIGELLKKENVEKIINPFATISFTEKKNYQLSKQQKESIEQLRKEYQKDAPVETTRYMTIRTT